MQHELVLYKKSVDHTFLNEEDILQKITGGSFSAGAVVVDRKFLGDADAGAGAASANVDAQLSALFVDGRYSLAAKLIVDPKKFEIIPLSNKNVIKWVEKFSADDTLIFYDLKYFKLSEINFFKQKLPNYSFEKIDLNHELKINQRRLTPNIYEFTESWDKFSEVKNILKNKGLDAYLFFDNCSIAWLLNIRDLNMKFTPSVLGCFLLTAAGDRIFFPSQNYESFPKISSCRIASCDDLFCELKKLQKVGIDPRETPSFVQHKNFVHCDNPIEKIKSIKSAEEISNIKETARLDSLALIKFIHWFETNQEDFSELDVVEKISFFRKQNNLYVGESFETIAAADDHAAIIHYAPTQKTNARVKNILLLDSGGQYKNGTTDITRTLCKKAPAESARLAYTLVLKGHIALANAEFSPDTPAKNLDKLARQFLLEHGMDYAHGTGHGIGYMLHVHEGHVQISSYCDAPLQPGMLMSNEPGYYLENQFGIRLENMMFVEACGDGANGGSNGNGETLKFETISLVPFDPKFIEFDLLTADEKKWINEYHEKILEISELDKAEENWLKDFFT